MATDESRGEGPGRGGRLQVMETLDVVSLVIGRKVVYRFQKVSLLAGAAGPRRRLLDFERRLETELLIRGDSAVTTKCTHFRARKTWAQTSVSSFICYVVLDILSESLNLPETLPPHLKS